VLVRRFQGRLSAVPRAGEGLPSSRRHHLNVPRPIRRGVPHGCTSRVFTASIAFAPISRARHSLHPPPRGWTCNDAAGFASCYGPLSRFPCKGFRHWASTPGVSPDAASLLPGLLAATRTGLPPAGGGELTTTDHLLMATSCLLGARTIEAN